MNKLLLAALCAAAVSVQAQPIYEPFTEYSNACVLSGSNVVNLCTNGFTVAGGSVWGSLNFSGTAGTNIHGVDVLVTNMASSVFTYSALSSILPANFPGLPASGQAINTILVNPAQPFVNGAASANIVGNSAVLKLAQDVVRPASGTKTIYISYLFSVAQQGQLGSGNDGRYFAFVEGTNLVEGTGSGGAYTTWASMFNTFNGTVHYAGHGLLQSGTSFFIGACDTSTGKDFTTSPFVAAYNTPKFVVGSYTFAAGSGLKDTNSIWVNPGVGSFGGAVPPSGQQVNVMAYNLTDIGGLVFIDRVGSGASGGVGTNYVANLLIGSTWSYVTGGPEFTNQPVTVNTAFGGSASMNAAAVAAGQGVSYQWQKIANGVTNNVSNGSGAAGGTATVSGSTTSNLTLTGISGGDLGVYQVVATASGTGFTLASATAALTSDPTLAQQPQSLQTNYGTVATFTASASTTDPSLSYFWVLNGATPLANGAQTDGSFVAGASGTVSGGTNVFTLSLSNVSYLDAGTYSLVVTNNVNNSAASSAATLLVNDPWISAQPTNESLVNGQTAVLAVTAKGSQPLSYQWFMNGTALSDGAGPGGSTINGSLGAVLTISGANDANAGSYYVTITGNNSGQITNSATVTLGIQDPVVLVTPPASRTERVGDHLAFAVAATGGSLTYQWQLNGSSIPGAISSALVLTNIQTTNAGTYTVVVANAASTNSASASLSVINSPYLPLASTNILVSRVGDGAQALSGTTGNTIYLDQYTSGGLYVSTVQVPDEAIGAPYGTGGGSSLAGSPALLVQGAGADAANEAFLTLSGGNQQFLCLAGYCQQYPFSGADVTAVTATTGWRGLATLNAFGGFAMAYTNFGLYNGGNHTIRSMVTLDGTNFWTTGQAGAGGVKYVNSTVASYATGNGIPSSSATATGTHVVQIVNGPLTGYSSVNNLVCSDAGGLYISSGLPEPVAAGTITFTQLINEGGVPNDFAFSPDNQTVYIADSQEFSGTNVPYGGVQRWDTNSVSSGWSYSYTLPVLPAVGGVSPTNGAEGMTVYFPPTVTSWGPAASGAVIYVTTYGASGNSLVQIIDNGPASAQSVVATAGPNQAFRGVRFGPSAVPVAITSQPASQTNFPNNSVTFSVAASGSAPLFYQWSYDGTPIPGATQSTFTTNNLSLASSGNYSVVVSNLVPSSVTSSNAVLTVTAGAPVITAAVQSYVEGMGDHLAFCPAVTGSQPLGAQWYFNSTNNPIAGATNINLVLTNIQTGQSGSYIFYVTNVYGSAHSAGSLTVLSVPPTMSTNNLVIARVGDGAQALSGATGNTLYLDQFTTSGVYVSSTQVPDEGTGSPYGTGGASSATQPFGSPALLVVGYDGTTANDGPYEGLLTRSADGQTINFAGYCEAYPFIGTDLTVGANGGTNWRGIGSLDAFGYYSLVYTNTGLYSGGAHQIHSGFTLDQTNYWTTGEAGAGGGLKYVTPGFEPANGGGIPAVAGSAAGTRVAQVFNGNLLFSDSVGSGGTGPGIYELSGAPETTSSPYVLAGDTNSPVDFALSPDGQTMYVADNGTFSGTSVMAGGIQRWDIGESGTFFFNYALPTSTNSTAGARGLTVDFSASATWGYETIGAKIYATSAEPVGNRLIKLVDNNPSSLPITLITAGANNSLSGVRFGPAAVPVSLAVQPQDQVALTGEGASFSAVASGSTPIYYQWQFNGTNIPGATQSTLSVSPAQAVLPGSYTVVASNQIPSTATSAPVAISFVPVLGFNGDGSGWSMNGTAGSGLPVYLYGGYSNVVELTQSVGAQGSSTFYQYPVYVGGFLATWVYQVVGATGAEADGTTFVIQNDARGAAALGSAGGSLGYGNPGAITNSVALEFNLYSGAASGTGIAVDTNGAIGPNTVPGTVLLDSGDPIYVSLQYLNGEATLTLLETNSTYTNTFTTTWPVNVPALVGSNLAYVGFTAGDGSVVSTQTISNFVFISLIGLTATETGTNTLALTWPTGVGGYVLQQNTNLATANWTPVAGTVNNVNGANQVIVPVSAGQTFYRLVNP